MGIFGESLVSLISIGFIVILGLLQVLRFRAKRRAENKVRMADPILRADIKILARMNSRLLDDAIILRSAQIEPGHYPAS